MWEGFYRNGDGDKIVKMIKNCQAGCESHPIDWEDTGKYIWRKKIKAREEKMNLKINKNNKKARIRINWNDDQLM